MKKYIILLILFSSIQIFSQDTIINNLDYKFNLSDVVKLAISDSPQFYSAKSRFLSAYWGHRNFEAEKLPSVTIRTNPISVYRGTRLREDNSIKETKSFNSQAEVTVNQNIPLTGGTVFVKSNLTRASNLDNSDNISYRSDLVKIGFSQPIFNFNRFKWQNKIEPLKFEIAKKSFVESLERISNNAIKYYFNLASAMINLDIHTKNYASNDTLHKISMGRFQMGKISQNELLQMELNKLNSESSVREAQLNLRSAEIKLISFLGLKNTSKIKIMINDSVPNFKVLALQVFELTKKNNPKYLQLNKQLLESERSVAQAEAGRYFSATIGATVGITNNTSVIGDLTQYTKNSQSANINFTIPIIDWGFRRGKYKMAQYNAELVKLNIDKEKIEFEQNLDLFVRRFNMQESQLEIAKKANIIAQNRFDITRKRFLLGKITVLELDKAITEKDRSKNRHINSLKTYWDYYYQLRAFTLYDFETKQSLTEKYSSFLLEEY